MKKILLSTTLVLVLSSSVFAVELPSAKDMRIQTDIATQKAYEVLLQSEVGKSVYENLTQIFIDNIQRISKDGYYDTFTIHYMNSGNFGHEEQLKRLNKKNKEFNYGII